MSASRERYLLEVISGARRGPAPASLRLLMTVAEPFYATAMRLRNALYDRGLKRTNTLPRPTISIGNITTGGTGKTPVVRWLAEALRSSGRKPAILLRGYKSTDLGSDEASLYGEAITVVPNPDRRRGAAQALAAHPEIDVFLLDDAMQHRRVARDLEIVLLSAVEPFGMSHVLPRGLLREPLAGLRRADAFILTHSSETPEDKLAGIQRILSKHNARVPVFRADHLHTALRAGRDADDLPMTALSDRRYFVACGIGQPDSLLSGLRAHGPHCVGHHFFADHHDFTANDVSEIRKQATGANAQAIVVTEKDWVKLSRLPATFETGVPFWRVLLGIQFHNDDGDRLLQLVQQRITSAAAAAEDRR